MSPIQASIHAAAQRLDAQRRMSLLPWTLGGAAIVALGAIALPKIWAWDRSAWLSQWWSILCILSAVAAGFLLAEILVRVRRTATLKAAIEIDRRLGLRERISTTCTLPPDLANSEEGAWIQADAWKHLEGIDLKPSFPVQPPRSLAAAILLLLTVGLLGWLLPDASLPAADASQTTGDIVSAETREAAAKELEAVLEKVEQLSDELDLQDADALQNALRAAIEEFKDGESLAPEEALARLNDLKEQLKERTQNLSDAASIREAIEKLGEISSGPADEFIQAMKDGDLEQALESLDELSQAMNDLSNPEASQETRQAAAEQIDQLAKQLQQQADQARQLRQDLEQRLERARQNGNLDEAARLEKQLEQQANAEPLEELAESVKQAAEAQAEAAQAQAAAQEAQQQAEAARAKAEEEANRPAGEGETEQQRQERIAAAQQQAQAAEAQAQQAQQQAEQAAQQAQQATEQMQQNLQQAQQDLDNLEQIEGTLEQLDGARAQLRSDPQQAGQQPGQQSGQQGGQEGGNQPGNQSGQSESSSGQGSGEGGQGDGEGSGDGQGDGNGAGQGTGDRPEEATDVGFFDSRNPTRPMPGEVVIGGQVGGPNRPGSSNLSTREAVNQSLNDRSDPIGEQRLPRSRRDHVRGYFERFRDGGK